jgi:hypothetical protein
MTEAATVYWFHVEAKFPAAGEGRDCKFESFENAVRFVMEELSDEDRAATIIQTDNGTIHIEDIQKMYAASSPPSRAAFARA